MVFKRKKYKDLLEWKEKYAGRYSLLIEGARRVGKSTLVETFSRNEYKSSIIIDFANVSQDIMECFKDIGDIDVFFFFFQTVTGVHLYEGESVIVFDEIQLYPKARQALKYLVQHGKYHYIATGSLISIKKNVKDILIPSEEKRIQMHPMDYEEFCWATQSQSYSLLSKMFDTKKEMGQAAHRKSMRDFRIYMAVGGMPQAVNAYIEGKSFAQIDEVKRDIIHLYKEDFKKIDPSGYTASIFESIPAQLSKNKKRFVLSQSTSKKKTDRDDERIYDLIDSKTVLISHNTTDPRVSLSLSKDLDSYKLYLADTGLFVTLLFMDRPSIENELYAKLLADKLPANLGYLYENVVAQMIAATDRDLYYHTWEKENSSHYYEVDFLVSQGTKVNAIEVKSSGTGKHESLTQFRERFSKVIGESFVLSQKDRKKEGAISFIPVYMTDFILK